MDEIPLPQQEPVEGVGSLPSALLHEGCGGRRRDAGNLHAPCGQFHHDEPIVRHQAVPRRDFDGEEVGRREDGPMQPQKLCPAHPTLPALWGGLQVMAAHNVAHRQLVDGMPQVRESTLDTAIAPGPVLFGHTHDELLNLLLDTRTSKRAALLTPVKLLGDQSLGPAQEGLGCDEDRHVVQAFASKRVGECREATPTELRFEHAIFFAEIGDDLLLMTRKRSQG